MCVRPLGDDAYNDNIARAKPLRRADGLALGNKRGEHDVAFPDVAWTQMPSGPFGATGGCGFYASRVTIASLRAGCLLPEALPFARTRPLPRRPIPPAPPMGTPQTGGRTRASSACAWWQTGGDRRHQRETVEDSGKGSRVSAAGRQWQ